MIPVAQLNLGHFDAANYRNKDSKQLFNKIFLQTVELDRLLESTRYFLVGEKGTGKTAYAVFLSNNDYKNTSASIKFLRETTYLKFIELKKQKHLQLSDYSDIWKVILYLLISQQIYESERNRGLLNRYLKFKSLQAAIDTFYNDAFSPEIIYAINFAEDSKHAAELISSFEVVEGQVGTQKSHGKTFSEHKFQINLLYIQRKFEEALSSLKLDRNYILFIDGIDSRPSAVPYHEYLECIKGLADAVVTMNGDYFASIKDSKGRLRVILLIRPDIFNSLGLQNLNTKLRENSVSLSWDTEYTTHRHSNLFEVADNILKWQQTERLERGDAWDNYFPFDAKDVQSHQDHYSSFIQLLRYSLYRPRDIVFMLQTLQRNFVNSNRRKDEVFSLQDLKNPNFQKEVAKYHIGEIRDQMLFYYSENEYEIFLRFFEYLSGNADFDYPQFSRAYDYLMRFISDNKYEVPSFCKTREVFLQFLYELNIMGYKEMAGNEVFWRWCFRQRYYGDISPKVKMYSNYSIHAGMRKALNIGKEHY